MPLKHFAPPLRRRPSRVMVIPVLVVAVAVAVVAWLWLGTHAGSQVALETEWGHIKGAAGYVTPAGSSNNGAVEFGAETRSLAKYEPSYGQTYLGVSAPNEAFDAFNTAAGQTTHPAIYNGFTGVDTQIQTPLSKVATSYPDFTPMVSWNVDFRNGAVTNGSKDAYLTAQATTAKNFGKPMFIRLGWEMNGTWSPSYDVSGGTTPDQYIASWKYIHALFASAGVTNVAWVWCPNSGRPNPDHLSPFTWYPGDDQVDWIALDSYPQYGSPLSAAVTNTDGLNDFATNAAAHQKPLMLAEWARGTSPDPPDTADVINLVFDWAERYPATVKALVYFDNPGTKYHELENYPVAAAAYRARTVGNNKYLLRLVNQ